MSKVEFQTNSNFLADNFPFLKQGLKGDWRLQRQVASPRYLIERNVFRQPVLDLSKNLPSSPSPVLTVTHSACQQPAFWNTVLDVFMGIIIALAVVVLVAVYGPKLYYIVFPGETMSANNQAINQVEQEFVDNSKAQQQVLSNKSNHLEDQKERRLPPKDDDLPVGEWLIIPKIGVNSRLQRTENEHEALNTGLWWVPDFGEPGELDKPMIVAGHRFGWKWWWQSDYWQQHSFYRLPELQPGDTIEVVSDQRKWHYQIYQIEEGTDITDYEADLILYTCKHLNSPIRYFRYAKLMREQH